MRYDVFAPFPRLLVHSFVAIAFAFTLAGCDKFKEPPRPKHRPKQATSITKPQKSQADARDFLLNLSLARIALSGGGDGPAEKYLKEAQRQMPPAKSSEYVPAVVVAYKTKAEGQSRIAIPFAQAPGKASFPLLPEAMSRLGSKGTLYDIRPLVVRVTPGASRTLGSSRQDVDQQLARLLKQTRKLTPLNEAQVQVQLVKFFIDYRFREAAYISVDNAKQSVASALQSVPAQKEALQRLSRELEALESQLHKTMPFKFSSLAPNAPA